MTVTLHSWGTTFVGLAWPMLVQSTVLMALLLAITWACRRVRAVFRYVLLLLILVKLMLPPWLSLPTGPAYWFPIVKAPILSRSPATDLTTQSPIIQLKAATAQISTPAVLFLIWIAGLCTLSVFILRRYRNISRLQRMQAPAELQRLLEQCRECIGLRESVALRLSTVRASPAAFGLFRPVILIPKQLADNLTLPQLRHVLLHELTHIKRRDLWVNHLQVALQVLYWYNPLLWLTNALIRRFREEAVDESITAILGPAEAEAYPATLVAVAKLAFSRPSISLGFIGIIEPKAALKRRLARLLENPVPKTANLGWGNSGLILALAGLLLPMAPPESNYEQTAQHALTVAAGDPNGATNTTNSDLDEKTQKEIAKFGRASLVNWLQTQGLTFEQYRERIREQILAETVTVASNTVAMILIRHLGPAFVTDEWISRKIAAKVGAPTTRMDLDSDVRNLYATGLFYNVRITQEPSPQGMTLTYIVQEKPRVSEIIFEGNTRLEDGALRKMIATRLGEPLDGRRLFNDAQTIQENYGRLGFSDTVAKYNINIDERTGRGTVTFQISEGQPTRKTR